MSSPAASGRRGRAAWEPAPTREAAMSVRAATLMEAEVEMEAVALTPRGGWSASAALARMVATARTLRECWWSSTARARGAAQARTPHPPAPPEAVRAERSLGPPRHRPAAWLPERASCRWARRARSQSRANATRLHRQPRAARSSPRRGAPHPRRGREAAARGARSRRSTPRRRRSPGARRRAREPRA